MATARAAFAGNAAPAFARTAGRAVHVKVHPQPHDLAESREVLRVLQRYGEVVVYKHLKHEPNLHATNTALAIYQNTNSAQDALNASPLRFELRKKMTGLSNSKHQGSVQISAGEGMREEPPLDGEQSQVENSDDRREWLRSLAKGRGVMREPAAGTTTSSTSYTGLGGTSGIPNSQYAQATSIPTSTPRFPKPFTSNPTPSSTTSTSLPYPPSPSSTAASPSTNNKEDSKEFHLTITRSVLNHQAYIQRQHYYGGFRLDKLNTMAEDLQLRVPVKGMMDCQLTKGEAPLRMRLKRRDNKTAGEMTRRPLRDLWEEGKREREERAGQDSEAQDAVG